jgi:hypothetical protein
MTQQSSDGRPQVAISVLTNHSRRLVRMTALMTLQTVPANPNLIASAGMPRQRCAASR